MGITGALNGLEVVVGKGKHPVYSPMLFQTSFWVSDFSQHVQLRGAVKKHYERTFPLKGGGDNNPCPLRKCKFLVFVGRGKIALNFLVFIHE